MVSGKDIFDRGGGSPIPGLASRAMRLLNAMSEQTGQGDQGRQQNEEAIKRNTIQVISQ